MAAKKSTGGGKSGKSAGSGGAAAGRGRGRGSGMAMDSDGWNRVKRCAIVLPFCYTYVHLRVFAEKGRAF